MIEYSESENRIMRLDDEPYLYGSNKTGSLQSGVFSP
jgi:hypothetical protein